MHITHFASQSGGFAALCRLSTALTIAAAIEPASKGQTVYVPIYSEIRHGNVAASGEPDSTQLAVLISVCNTDANNPIRITAAPYYNTDGVLIRDSVPTPEVIALFANL